MSRSTDELYEVMLMLEQEGYELSYDRVKRARERMIRMEELILDMKEMFE